MSNNKDVWELCLKIHELVESHKTKIDSTGGYKKKAIQQIRQAQLDCLIFLKQYKTVMQAYGDRDAVMWEDIQAEIDKLEAELGVTEVISDMQVDFDPFENYEENTRDIQGKQDD